jgi:TRAP-type C4-dicarboxylate transport system permease small subunit
MKAKLKSALLTCLGTLSACASLFFCYYMLRLAYLDATGAIDAAHRTAGLHIGAAVFPVAAFGFGWISLACFSLTSTAKPLTVKQRRTQTPSAPGSDR